MTERLEAQVQTRIFYFTVVQQKDTELSILMYSTPYTLIKTDEKWANHVSNRMIMSPELIEAVVKAAYKTVGTV